ncbi:MAG: hypothetical protein LBR88_02170 [Zoogloeaceae bacterium]|jgi:hypothetical protein|nr:hypothetical protein [Zoogloeaceae bacterium]
MPDLADLAQLQQEHLDAFTRAGAWKPVAPEATGFCLNCGAPLAQGLRWCDTDCRDDWQEMDALLRKQGL